MSYTIQEASELSGFSVSTLRYYDERGVFPRMPRDEAGNRLFDDGHIEWLCYLRRLKDSGMTVGQLSDFGVLISGDDATLEQRKAAVLAQRDVLEDRLRELLDGLEILDYSLWYCNRAREVGGERELGEGRKTFAGTYARYLEEEPLRGRRAAVSYARDIIDRYAQSSSL